MRDSIQSATRTYSGVGLSTLKSGISGTVDHGRATLTCVFDHQACHCYTKLGNIIEAPAEPPASSGARSSDLPGFTSLGRPRFSWLQALPRHRRDLSSVLLADRG